MGATLHLTRSPSTARVTVDTAGWGRVEGRGRHSDTGSGDEGGEAPVENLEDVLWNASLHFQ